MNLAGSRKLKQYGWISGPVECCCTECDWSLNFTAADSSIPVEIVNAFVEHDCREYERPHQIGDDRYCFSRTGP